MSEVEQSPEPSVEPQDSQPETVEQAPEDTLEQTPPEPKGVAKRLKELVDARNDARAERDYWRSLAIQPKQPEPPPVQPQAPQGKPTADQFESYDAYLEALTDWKVGDMVRAREAEAQRQREAQEAQTLTQQFDSRAMAFAAEVEDYQQVALDPTLPVSDAMAQVIRSSEKGPQILYHLGQNRAEAMRLYQMQPLQAALEIGRLEARLAVPQPRRSSTAPPPVNPVVGGVGTPTLDPMKLSAEEWARRRNEQIAQRNKRG